MKQVKLSKVTLDEIKVLQAELSEFAEWQKMGLHFWSNEDFFNAIATVDTSLRMYYLLRTKIESGRNNFTMSFKIADAVAILKCCHWQRSERTIYEENIAMKYKNIIDQQLKSIITY